MESLLESNLPILKDKAKKLILGFLTVLLVTSLPSCATSSVKRPAAMVICGTTLISSIVQEIGGDRLNAISIIPPEQNPVDYFVKPENITLLSGANFFIIHDWQQGIFSRSVIDSANNPFLKVAAVQLDGDWMIPEFQSRATDKIRDVLKTIDVQNSTEYDTGATAYHLKIIAREDYLKDQLRTKFFKQPLNTIDVISAAPVADFVKYIGLNVIATYDKLTPEREEELVRLGRERGTKIVVDCLQTGANAGAKLSEQIGASRAILSGYPGGAPYTVNWEDSVARSLRSVIGVLEECG